MPSLMLINRCFFMSNQTIKQTTLCQISDVFRHFEIPVAPDAISINIRNSVKRMFKKERITTIVDSLLSPFLVMNEIIRMMI